MLNIKLNYWYEKNYFTSFKDYYGAARDEPGARSSWIVTIRTHWSDIKGISISLFHQVHADECVQLWEDHQLDRIRPRTAPTQPNILAGVNFEGEIVHADTLVGYLGSLVITRSGAYNVRAKQPKIAKSDIVRRVGTLATLTQRPYAFQHSFQWKTYW